ncbi:MAG: rubrerythrin family protein [Candidatus Brocadiia bacterium]|nr:rubrerythrin family protein [Planctomycetota bacterium]
MSQTDDNLQKAFAGESQANRKYTAFARKAEDEGYKQVAHLFRAAAAAETVHALNHLEVMSGVKSTLENLKEAAQGEADEFEEMYPAFIQVAEDEGEPEARRTFDFASRVEEIHHMLYNRAVDAVKKNEDLPETKLWVCQGCGNTVEGEPPAECPICGAPRSMFLEIE